jgi:hypothetical protein
VLRIFAPVLVGLLPVRIVVRIGGQRLRGRRGEWQEDGASFMVVLEARKTVFPGDLIANAQILVNQSHNLVYRIAVLC